MKHCLTDIEGLTARTLSCLHAGNIYTIDELCELDEVDLLKMPNIGRKSINEIKAVLSGLGRSLGTKRKCATVIEPTAAGIPLRDWFAGLAMQAYVTSQIDMTRKDTSIFAEETVAKIAYQFADAMLNARDWND